MQLKLFIAAIILALTGFPELNAQKNYHTKSTRALNAYLDGKEQYDFLYYDKAEKYLKEAIRLDKKFYEAYLLLGDMYSKLLRFEESARYYREAVRLDSLFYKPVFFSLANAEMRSGDYKRALIHFSAYIDLKAGPEKNILMAYKSVKDCEFSIKAIASPVPFAPQSADSVNTKDDEYWPSITADGQTLMFTRQVILQGGSKKSNEDFYVSYARGTLWSKAFNAGPPLNTPQNEGAQSIASDGRYMYFTACDRTAGLGRCDLYYSGFDGSRWSPARNVGAPVNSNFWESQPSISANGRMLFFTSNRPGGLGGMDIWYSVKNEYGAWKEPENLGEKINTTGDEMSPFIHFDSKTLYFSSNGQVGLGGHDIYMSKMLGDSAWSEPENLGYPINTYNDELGLIINAEGSNAYFSSVRDPKKGKDIFFFSLYENARPDPVSYFRGKVYDSETMAMLKSDYELVNLRTGEVVSSGQTDGSGSFLVCLPSGFNYGLNVNKPGYLFYSDNFMMEGEHSATEPFNKKILLNRIKIGESFQLANVFYEIDSWELKKESLIELDKLFRLLKDNPGFSVEISGFTDSTGTAAHNQVLSERRALSVVNYLKERGIEAERLSYMGFGSASPVGTNVTREGRRLNRRTEVRITGKK
jgi:outer membrane protein OmpA-like peptidoglycan-associated protein